MTQASERARPAVDTPIRDRLTRALAQRILEGTHRPGDRLPVEADLIAEFGVSRTALREAMRMLAAKGLIVSRKRAGTVVRPSRDWNLLDPDILGWMGEVAVDPGYVADVCEARLVFEPKAARLAAIRGSADEVAAIDDAFGRMRAAHLDDDDERLEADLAFHFAILDAAHNRVLHQLGNIIGPALRTIIRSSASATSDYDRGLRAHAAVRDAILARDGGGADRAMTDLISVTAEDLGLVDLLR